MTAVGLLAAVTCMGARPLSEAQLQQLHRNRYVVVSNWIAPAQTLALQQDAIAVDVASGWDCMVGTAQNGNARLDPNVRRSRERSFYPPPSNCAGSTATRAALIDAVNTLRIELQESAVMALPYLIIRIE